MNAPLRPCPACHRHIRIDDSACPFCRFATPPGFSEVAAPRRPGRLGRAAIFAFGATLAGASCEGDAPLPADSGQPDNGGVMPLYGAVSPDAGANPDEGGGQPEYGAVPAPPART